MVPDHVIILHVCSRFTTLVFAAVYVVYGLSSERETCVIHTTTIAHHVI